MTTVTVEQFPEALEKVLRKYTDGSLKTADKVLSKVTLDIFGGVIEDTPVGDFDPEHEGTLKGSWSVTKNAPSTSKVRFRQPQRKRDSIKTQISAKMASQGVSMYLTSNNSYVNTVEFGGYPKAVRKGTFNKVTKRFEIRSSGGFSKQAPKGMVRKNARRFKQALARAAKSL